MSRVIATRIGGPLEPAREFRPYRRFGDPSRTPGEGGAAEPAPAPFNAGGALRPEEARQRRERFASPRASGASVADASAALGISPRTGQKYESERRRDAA